MEMVSYGPATVSSRLHTLLESAREANNNDANRVSLGAFLARLQNEAEAAEDAQLKQTQLSIASLIRNALEGRMNELACSQDTSASQATQTLVATASRAIQTDAATISMWEILPQARKEAYDRGFHAGKEDGLSQGITQGKALGTAEGWAAGVHQGRAEVLQQARRAELQRDNKFGKQIEYEAGMANGRQRNEEESNARGQSAEISKPTEEVMQEKIVVRLPSSPKELEQKTATSSKNGEVTVSIETRELTPIVNENEATPIDEKSAKWASRKDKVKPKSTGVDPFQSLLGLAFKKQ